MVLESKPVAKPKPNRALASHDRGEYIEYASSEMLGLHDNDRSARRAPTYESSHRHEKSCRCLDCRLYRWQLDRAAWRDFEANHGALPPLPAHRPTTDREIDDWNRIVALRHQRSIARLRRVEQWYDVACSCRKYPPVWMIDQIFGDDGAVVDIEDQPERGQETLGAAMNYVRAGAILPEGEGHYEGQDDAFEKLRAVEMVRDANGECELLEIRHAPKPRPAS